VPSSCYEYDPSCLLYYFAYYATSGTGDSHPGGLANSKNTRLAGLVGSLYRIDANALKADASALATALRNEDFSADCAGDIANLGITPEQWADAL